jgi:hypothetical protein
MLEKLRQLVNSMSVIELIDRFHLSAHQASALLEEARTTTCEQRALWLYRELN